ncbi:hypothetical protein B0H66DRAFT_574100 [Apodospora peruviana]|uniref:Amine oxidase n=1 Tax=Apodospora peruviana TaxID=516989 RepID=A0AAE0IKL6_9PEZI|nr:hypothetical protein B0H66DRAFT_574100 [Apodospora peruviana]
MLLSTLLWSSAAATVHASIDSVRIVRTIHKDVAIVGGGGSGAYSAVRLREDYGVSVVVIEKEIMLGGHVNTWVDPATGRGYDAGVQNYIDLANATAFFARLNVTTQANVRASPAQVYADFTTGVELTNYSPPAAADRTDALKRYLALAEQYLPVMEPGWWTFPEPVDIPADLLLPFRDFVIKHNLTAGVPQIFATTGFGIHDLLGSLTMWVMRSFNIDMVRTLLGIDAAFVPASRKNQDLYDAIQRLLGSNALLSSTVTKAERSEKGGVVLEVRSSVTGKTTRIVAKKLLFTAPPTNANMVPFDLDSIEKSVFGDFSYSATYVGVVSHPSLPANTSILNTPVAAQPANWLEAIPKAPFNTRFDNYPNSSYYRVIAVGDQTYTESQARQTIIESFDKLMAGGTITQTSPPEPLKFLSFEPHGLVSAYASREALESGFIQRLNGLQGRRSTWYTGAAWSVHISTSLWVFTDTLLLKLVASLR